ncbi:MAG TPA: phospholipase D-like domain-containing protein [Chitinophagaceae bacterium]|nr:phospholipase D-like domain-containing protein [Chitinophagaceae bacterium]
MRARSKAVNGYVVYAVAGTHSVSFAIDFRKADTRGLLGFAVERIDTVKGERRFMDGYKVFRSLIPHPGEDTVVNTYSHPVQSFVWDDFTCSDGVAYQYLFYPVKGSPGHLLREKPVPVSISTEVLFSGTEHDIFFNRGAASSQAYRRRFFNLPPEKINDPRMKQQALDWLSRQLDEALLQFIGRARKGETLLGCFYEFHYPPVVEAFKKAMDKGVAVRLIIDAKRNAAVGEEGPEGFPRTVNLDTLQAAGISTARTAGVVIRREANSGSIQHNKFIVRIGKSGKAADVWTGSTNISLGGIHGQTNVGHWVRNRAVAEKYRAYWDLLSSDPGGRPGDDRATVRRRNEAFREAVEALQPTIHWTSRDDIPAGITPVFSPRSGTAMLETYVRMLDNAEHIGCITLAFGINALFKEFMKDNTPKSAISFLLLEKEDKPRKNSRTPFVFIGARQNVYQSWGAYLEDDLYQWTREVSTIGLGLNRHVAYIHSKFLLVDPLGDDPVVVTGSANFSEASTNENDENMLIIRGNTHVADIYFTEFNRLFHHYYFRAVYKKLKEQRRTSSESIFLQPDDRWLKKYAPGKLRYKRVEMFTKMGKGNMQ